MANASSLAFAFAEEEFPKLSSYRQLNTEEKEIRVLYVRKQTNQPNPMLCITTRTIALVPSVTVRRPDYYAISYCWGDAKNMKPAIVDGEQVYLRESVWECLKHLEHILDYNSLLWLDILCINQDDLRERNHQVSIMHEIYRNARAVYAYLGEATAPTNSLFDYIKNGTPSKAKYLKPADFSLPEGLPNAVPDWMNGVEDITLRPYFTRLWIIQEAVFARELWFLLGSEVTSMETLVAAQRSAPSTIHRLSIRSGACARLLAIDWIRQTLKTSKQSTQSLLSLLSWFSDCRCRDPRDNVYSLLAIASDKDQIKIDYARSPKQVWWDLFVVCTDRSRKSVGIYDQDTNMALMRRLFEKMVGYRASWESLGHDLAQSTSITELAVWSIGRIYKVSGLYQTKPRQNTSLTATTKSTNPNDKWLQMWLCFISTDFKFPWYDGQDSLPSRRGKVFYTTCHPNQGDLLISLGRDTLHSFVARKDKTGHLTLIGHVWFDKRFDLSENEETGFRKFLISQKLEECLNTPFARNMLAYDLRQHCSVDPPSCDLRTLETLYRDENWYELGLQQMYVRLNAPAVLGFLLNWPFEWEKSGAV